MAEREPIDIQFIRFNGSRTTDVVAGSPCIEVGFALRKPGQQSFDGVPFKRVLALIDTGASHILFDEVLLRDFPDCTPVTTAVNQALYSERELLAYPSFIDVRPWQFMFSTTALAYPPPPESPPWRLILGRFFLKRVRLDMTSGRGVISRIPEES